jgi:hypothetical protein
VVYSRQFAVLNPLLKTNRSMIIITAGSFLSPLRLRVRFRRRSETTPLVVNLSRLLRRSRKVVKRPAGNGVISYRGPPFEDEDDDEYENEAARAAGLIIRRSQ